MGHYSMIDPILYSWARSRTLHVYTVYQDYDVRSIEIESPGGAQCQLWLDRPDKNGNTIVHVWDRKNRSKKLSADIETLENVLEDAYQQTLQW